MSTTQKAPQPRLLYHDNAYPFLFAALNRTQRALGRSAAHGPEDERAHISGVELLEGIREFAHEQFGLMAKSVFHCWGINSTEDFGRMVFELIERGDMRKTENDQLADFVEVFDFDETFDRNYRIDTSHAFSQAS
ncbi:MAG: hypothetical protein EHM42_00280 [Planctomycetaceae bacterium]|nr:MAG: hypothetical protein EHM42_00280 [Planctomycetaceae bacterium]